MHINDISYDALVNLGAPKTHTNDMIWDALYRFSSPEHLQINDMWHQLWDLWGIPAGAFNDRATEYLTILGYQGGTISELWFHFWSSIADEYQHLEDHPAWYNLTNTSPSNAYYKKNVYYVYQNPTAIDQAVAFSTRVKENVQIQCIPLLDNPTDISGSYIMAGRMQDEETFVGATPWQGRLSIYERNNGTWAGILTGDDAPPLSEALNKLCKLHISGSQASLDIAGTVYHGTQDVTVLTPGRVGMIVRFYNNPETELCREFTFK